MKRSLCLLCSVLMPAMVWGAMHKMNISDAIRTKAVTMTAVNTSGDYTGPAVTMTVTNLQKDSLSVTIDIGVILKPGDPSYQPMVLAGGEQLVLAPKEKNEVNVEVFCGNAPRHCPAKDLHYTYWRKGSDTLIKVLRFIHDSALFDYLGQAAVWVVTNNHAPGSVYDSERDAMSKKLISVVCAATGKPKPDYYTVTAKNTNPGAAAYTPKTLKIIAQFDVVLKTRTILSVNVYNEEGFLIEKTFERRSYDAGAHQIAATFDAEQYGAGKYFIRLSDAQRVLQEKKVVAEK